MAPRSSIWDHKADKDLLLAIIEEGSLKNIIWPNISDKMQAKNYTFTKEACRQHFQKIRKEARTGGGSADYSPTRTPSKPKATPSKSSPSKGAHNASFASSGYGYENDDDEEDMSTPLKRKREVKEEDNGYGRPGQTARIFKIENSTGNRGPIDLENDDLYEAGYA